MNIENYALPSWHGGVPIEEGSTGEPPSHAHHSPRLPLHRMAAHSVREDSWRDSHHGTPSSTGSPLVHGWRSTPNHSTSATLAWAPSRLTSPDRVLSAAGMRDDYYTSCLSWGHTYVGLALRDELLMFHSAQPRERYAVFRFRPSSSSSSDGNWRGAGATAASAGKRPTSVAMSRQSDSTCFVGFDDGTVALFLARGDSKHLVCGQSFYTPTPPVADLMQVLSAARGAATGPAPAASPVQVQRGHSTSGTTEADLLRQTEQTLLHLAPSLASVGTMDTSAAHPSVVAAGTAASGVVTLDARFSRPCSLFRSVNPALSGCYATEAGSARGGSPFTPSASPATAALQRVGTFLEHQERACAVRWNACGSLLAVGDDRGTVQIWSVTQPRAPLHTLVLGSGGSLRALAFHPTNPAELLVGCGTAGPHGLRLYDLSSSVPRCTWTGHTVASTTQALYSPDGAYIVTAGGEVTNAAATSATAVQTDAAVSAPHTRARPTAAVTNAPSAVGSPLWYGASSSLEVAATAALTEAEATQSGPRAHSLARGDVGDGDLHDAPQQSTSPFDATGRPSSGRRSAPPSPEWAVSHALTVWKRGAPRGSHDMLRDALLDTTTRSPTRWNDLLRHPSSSSRGGSGLEGSPQDGLSRSLADSVGYGSPLDVHMNAYDELNGGESVLVPLYALGGHASRPLHLVAPYNPSPYAGCVASAAAGEDGTLRFWRVFSQGGAAVAATSAAAGLASSGHSRTDVVATYDSRADDAQPSVYLDLPLR